MNSNCFIIYFRNILVMSVQISISSDNIATEVYEERHTITVS